MKFKIICLSSLFFWMASCSQKENSGVSSDHTAVSEQVATGDKSLEGYQLITGSDCLMCHKDNDKLMGPSYAEIAAKYTAGDMDVLASKIIEGSSGVWGDFTMTPHPNLSKEEAKKMVAYILSMKK